MAKDNIIPLGLYYPNGSKMKSYNTIEDMKSDRNLVIDQVVNLLGYYKQGDGAEHQRKISNEDDGSGVLLANGLYANVIHNGEINIKWLGAKGNGIDDDTSFFNTNFNLLIPKGEFLISDIIKTQNGNSIRGDNMYESIIKLGTDKDGIWINTDCSLKNISFNSDLEVYNSDVIRIGDEAFTTKGKLSSMCGISIKNIASNVSMGSGNGNLFHILYSAYKENGNHQTVTGYWGLKIEHIRYSGHFNRVFKIESKVRQQDKEAGWLTYSEVKDVKGWGAITAIEAVATYDVGDYDSNTYHPTIGVLFKDCNFESCNLTENGIIYNGLYLTLDNVICGDFFLAKPEYTIYKIYYYKKMTFYGTILLYTSRVINDYALSNITIVNFDETVDYFVKKYCNLAVLKPSVFSKIKDYIAFDINEYSSTNKKLVWLCSYNKKRYYAPSSESDNLISFSLRFKAKSYKDVGLYNDDVGICTFKYDISQPETPMKVYIKNSKFFNKSRFVYKEDEDNVQIGIVSIPEDRQEFLPIRKFFKLETENVQLTILDSPIIDISDEEFNALKKVDISYYGLLFSDSADSTDNLNLINRNTLIVNPLKKSISITAGDSKVYSAKLINEVQQLDTPYYSRKMEKEGVLQDFDTYMDEKYEYDKRIEQLERDKQLAYEEEIKTNPNLTYEEFTETYDKLNIVMLPSYEGEPQPSEKLKMFMEKYL